MQDIKLHPENIYGHSKKVRLTLEVMAQMRKQRDSRPLKVLDVGCGSGFAVTQFLSAYGDEVLGLDFYNPNIDYANRHFAKDNLQFLCKDANELRDEGKRYDVVVLTDVLEHLHQPENLLSLARDLLAPDGRVIVTIPNGFGPFEFESALHRLAVIGWVLDRGFAAYAALMNRTIFKGKWTEMNSRQPADLPYNAGSPHVQWFSKRRFRKLIGDCGLQVQDFRKTALLAGPFTNYVFGPFVGFCELNARIADGLPAALSSNWWMVLSKR